MPKAAIVMGSVSDLDVVKPTIDILKKFDVEVEARVISAHRTPQMAHDFANNAIENNIEVIICAAGKAAHLGGVIAAYTPLPVIGLPVKSSTMDGLDSLQWCRCRRAYLWLAWLSTADSTPACLLYRYSPSNIPTL